MSFEPPPSVAAAFAAMSAARAEAARAGIPWCETHEVAHEEDGIDFFCERCREAAAPVPQPDALFNLAEDPQSGATRIVYTDPRDAIAGAAEREAAISRVTNAAPGDWIEQAYDALVAIAHVKRLAGTTLTTDDVWAILAARGVEPPPERRAMAAVIRRGEREGLIEKTDQFVPSALPWAHRRNTQVWKVRT